MNFKVMANKIFKVLHFKEKFPCVFDINSTK